MKLLRQQKMQSLSGLGLFIIAVINFCLVPTFGIPPLVFGLILLLGASYFFAIVFLLSNRNMSRAVTVGVSVSHYILLLNSLFLISIIAVLTANFYQATVQILVATILYAFFSLIFWGVLIFVFIFIPIRLLLFIKNTDSVQGE